MPGSACPMDGHRARGRGVREPRSSLMEAGGCGCGCGCSTVPHGHVSKSWALPLSCFVLLVQRPRRAWPGPPAAHAGLRKAPGSILASSCPVGRL